MTTHRHIPNPAVEALTESMMESYGQVALLVDHMLRNFNPDGDPIPDVLSELMNGILGTLVRRHGVDEVATAARILSAATELLGEELFLVDADDLGEPGPLH
jgi:hypothetical protein